MGSGACSDAGTHAPRQPLRKALATRLASRSARQHLGSRSPCSTGLCRSSDEVPGPGEPLRRLRDRSPASPGPIEKKWKKGGDAGRAGLQREVLLLPGQPAPRALDRRPGRHQRRQELPERRRQRLPPLLRHGQGRRLPRARGQRLPPGRGQRQHHRPVRRPGRAVRPRVRRPARPTARSAAPRSRAPSTRAARPASSSCSAPTRRSSGRSACGKVEDVPAPRDARPGGRRRPRRGIVTRDLVTGKIESHVGDAVVLATGGYGNVFYLSTNAKGCNATAIWRAYKTGRLRQPRATRRSTRPASRSPATTSRSSR